VDLEGDALLARGSYGGSCVKAGPWVSAFALGFGAASLVAQEPTDGTAVQSPAEVTIAQQPADGPPPVAQPNPPTSHVRPDQKYEAWVFDGYDGPAPAVEEGVNAQLAWQLAHLVPRTHQVSMLESLSLADRQVAVLAVLDFWVEDLIPLTWQDAAYARLRGFIDEISAVQIAWMLQQEGIPRRTNLLNLLLEAPLDSVRQVLLDFVLDETNSAPDRGRVAESLILRDGRAAMEVILPVVQTESEAPFLRRLFGAWRTCVIAEDLTLLERLASHADGFVAQFALQLWAMNETDTTTRLRIYSLAQESEPSYCAAALSALAQGGKDPAITAALIGELDSAGRDMRQLAQVLIPEFSDEQTLLDAYLDRLPGMSLNRRGQWMSNIASLSLPAAKQAAMQWLTDGGWSKGNTARNVVRYLTRSAEVDPLLPTLLSIENLPKHILYPLTLARAETSADARDYLRQLLPELLPSEQGQALRALAASGDLDDLLLLRDYVSDPAKATSARVVAMRTLAEIPEAQGLLHQWRDPLPHDYEVLATLLELMLLSKNEEWQQWAMDTAFTPPAFFDEDEQRGLRGVIWRTLGERKRGDDHLKLSLALGEYLLQLQSVNRDDEGWRVLYRFEGDYPELATLVAAYVSCVRGREPQALVLPENFDSSKVGADALLITAAFLTKVSPQTTSDWFEDLAERSLHEENQVRVAGLAASRLPFGPTADAALQRLLDYPDRLRNMPRAIAESFAPHGNGWALIHDRLAEQQLLSEVIQARRPVEDLRILLQAWVEDDILATAAEFATDKERFDLALELELRRAVHLPLSTVTHAAVIKAAEKAGKQGLVAAERQVFLRLSPPDARK
jgi:hypothetical protein